jgi:hypothetical protein
MSDLRTVVLLSHTGYSAVEAFERSSPKEPLPYRQSFDIERSRGLGHQQVGRISGSAMCVYMRVCCGTEDEDSHFSRFKVIKEGTFKIHIQSLK